jgi:2-dehydro-3-deoxygluconokinase
MQLSDAKKIFCVAMPVADVLVEGTHAQEMMAKYGMIPDVRTPLSDAQKCQIREDVAADSRAQVVAGGSLTNTVTASQQLVQGGAQFTMFAACADDSYGMVYGGATRAAGVQLVPAEHHGAATSCSYIVVPDPKSGERAIARDMGDSMSHIKADAMENYIENSDMVLLEGELPSLPNGRQLWKNIIALAEKHSKPIGMTFLGAEQVERHHELFQETVEKHASFVFGNDDEIMALYPHVESVSEACEKAFEHMKARDADAVLCISQGSQEPYLHMGEGVCSTPPSVVANIVSTLGAGDAFMAGTLAGLLDGLHPSDCLKQGHAVASAVLQQAEPQLSAGALSAMKVQAAAAPNPRSASL